MYPFPELKPPPHFRKYRPRRISSSAGNSVRLFNSLQSVLRLGRWSLSADEDNGNIRQADLNPLNYRSDDVSLVALAAFFSLTLQMARQVGRTASDYRLFQQPNPPRDMNGKRWATYPANLCPLR
jgi:hypothetical protein